MKFAKDCHSNPACEHTSCCHSLVQAKERSQSCTGYTKNVYHSYRTYILLLQDGVNLRLETLIFRPLQQLNGEEAVSKTCHGHGASALLGGHQWWTRWGESLAWKAPWRRGLCTRCREETERERERQSKECKKNVKEECEKMQSSRRFQFFKSQKAERLRQQEEAKRVAFGGLQSGLHRMQRSRLQRLSRLVWLKRSVSQRRHVWQRKLRKKAQGKAASMKIGMQGMHEFAVKNKETFSSFLYNQDFVFCSPWI